MKTIAKYLAIITITTVTMFTSCVSNKKMQASNANMEQSKKDTIATHYKLNEKTATAVKKHYAHELHVVKHETHVSKLATNSEHFSPLPPSGVDSAFKISYPDASNIVWTNAKKNYSVSFLLHQKRQTMVYAENGKLVETRSEILPDQLPENVYESIKKQFPEDQIVSATTYKNARTNGSYTAVVKSKLHANEKILILAENGTIVKQ